MVLGTFFSSNVCTLGVVALKPQLLCAVDKQQLRINLLHTYLGRQAVGNGNAEAILTLTLNMRRTDERRNRNANERYESSVPIDLCGFCAFFAIAP